MSVTSRKIHQVKLISKNSCYVYIPDPSSHGIVIIAMNSLQQIRSLRVITKCHIRLAVSFTSVNTGIAASWLSYWYPYEILQ